jgi:hypothetical protein
MNATLVFTTAEAVSNATDTRYPSVDNTCYPSAETFTHENGRVTTCIGAPEVTAAIERGMLRLTK